MSWIDDHFWNPINKWGEKIFGDTDIYIGYGTQSGPQVKITPSTTQKYNYGNSSRSNTTAYKANAAGTANEIAQGGMTKDDILKYNEIHPNEIAGDNPKNNTALNTNTALRGK